MLIRTFDESDLTAVVALAVDVFGPFHEKSFRPVVGEVIFANQDADWRADYARQIPDLHAPAEHRRMAIAEAGGAIAGFVAWTVSPAARNGEITHVAVSAAHRGAGAGTALCEHAFAELRRAGAQVVTIGTGGDDFHAPARRLYESLGCTPFPVVTYYREL
ncbi:GNAT family N-acetyltransferase [Actinoplanes italicus]|uniref:Ribosomal protein S18 acetylase RimI-like enzyme n=1 Tax=Actinoplanes italicus TaxID=113567 RepID=A0A2T0K5P7_9ACTN|nr:GNAT family N-acetyltransferase [Actinoplanes italicus]PRX18297.1 ribosomal protein S18 acetylase RimI-like enzyme [Actinoplanes italicus]GIE32705.1 GNAT family N-acetyltransferase [Actinoplanes italicus]